MLQYVVAENSAGLSPKSEQYNFRNPALLPRAPPLAPTKLSGSRSSVVVQWDTPTHDGGDPILHYVVEARQVSEDDEEGEGASARESFDYSEYVNQFAKNKPRAFRQAVTKGSSILSYVKSTSNVA